MSALQADTQFGVSPTASVAANTAALQAAITAAANDQTRLDLPAGDLQFNADLVLPAGFTGTLGICGLGRKLTRLVPLGGCNGLVFDLSGGKTPANNSVEIRDLGFVASAATAGTAIRVSYGTASLGSVENQVGSIISNVEVKGGGWTNGIVLQQCWHAQLDGIYLFGNMSSYKNASAPGKGDQGAGSGVGLTFASGINIQASDITVEFFSQGVQLNNNGQGAPGDCQGVFIDDLQIVECLEGLHAYGTPGGYFTTLILRGWMVDNGNLNIPGHASLVFENAKASFAAFGQGLQNGGAAPNVTFSNCNGCKLIANSLEYRANTTGPDVLLTGTTTECEVLGNTCGGTIQLDGTTSGNTVLLNPGATVNDLGRGNEVALIGLQGPPGPAGVPGPQGPAGLAGPKGGFSLF